MNVKKAKQAVICLALIGLASPLLYAQERISKSINSNWLFLKDSTEKRPSDAAPWSRVSIPHSWNTADVSDDEPGYYRGTGWYRKKIDVLSSWKGKDVYLHFEGVQQVAEVFVNGKMAGNHTGGYSGFRIRMNKWLRFDGAPEELLIKVDNRHNEDIPPLSADFTFFGGIYRDIRLVAVDRVHFNLDNLGSSGVFISTPEVSAEAAKVMVRSEITNNGNKSRRVRVLHSIKDAGGAIVAKDVRVLSLSKDLNEGLSSVLSIKEPRLWSPETPYLYSVVSEIRDAENGSLLDRTVSPLGLRWFHFDAAKGFFLNGKPYKLIGASRHQDFQGTGNALSDALQIRDVELLKEMGGNFLRVAHYPQDPAVLQACDRLGLLASVEIPVVNRITESEAFSENCRQMQREMIRQNFNHPSVIIWAYMNEVLLRPRYTDDKVRQEQYFKRVAALAKELEDIARKEDPSRYTMIPNHGNFDLYNRTGLTRIPMLVGWNLYQGWYGGELKDFGKFLDEHRRRLPDKPLLVTEYGADADERLQADNPLRFDKSVGYTLSYHRAYLKAILERPFVAAAMVWNLSEFNSEERAETHPHVNDKGLLTLDRRIKDPYLFYQANLLKNPFLAIGSAGRTVRSGIAGADGFCSQTLDIFSNAKLVSLTVNGKKLSPIAPALGIARFQVPFMPGNNSIEAISDAAEGSLKDVRQIYFKMIPANLRDSNVPFTALNVSLGDKRFFNDERTREVWLPEKPYEPSSWGYINGKVFAMKGNSRQSYGSDKNILETDYDPIFATQRTGIKEFKFDVPDGKYELTLHFAELLSEREQQQLAYNLDTGKATERDLHADRAFNVLINGQKVIENLNNKVELEPETAISYTFETEARDIKGITVSFEPLKGETILNGIQLRKIY